MIATVVAALAALSTVLAPSPARAQDVVELARRSMADRAARWRCEPVRAIHCSAEQCQQIEHTVWMIVDFKAESYERCDTRGCDRRDIIASPSGIFTVVTVMVGGTFLKALNDGTEFVDVASLGTGILANFGRCRPLVQ